MGASAMGDGGAGTCAARRFAAVARSVPSKPAAGPRPALRNTHVAPRGGAATGPSEYPRAAPRGGAATRTRRRVGSIARRGPPATSTRATGRFPAPLCRARGRAAELFAHDAPSARTRAVGLPRRRRVRGRGALPPPAGLRPRRRTYRNCLRTTPRWRERAPRNPRTASPTLAARRCRVYANHRLVVRRPADVACGLEREAVNAGRVPCVLERIGRHPLRHPGQESWSLWERRISPRASLGNL